MSQIEDRFARRGQAAYDARMRRPWLLAPLVIISLTACSEQLDQATNDLASSALERAVISQLERAGITLQDGPECSTDFTRDGATLSGDAQCDGTAADGASVRAEFDGSLSGSGCSGSLGVFVDDQSVAQLDEIPDCSVSL